MEYSPKIRKRGYVKGKRAGASQLVNDITSRVKTDTNSAILNKYIEQNFLDNVLRGGLSLQLGGEVISLPNKKMTHPPSKFQNIWQTYGKNPSNSVGWRTRSAIVTATLVMSVQ